MDPSAALDALGDPTRREIFERLVARPSRIGFLADHVAVSRPDVSHHVKVLKAAGLVRDDRFTLLTIEPGPDIAPFHNRQIAILPRSRWAAWLGPPDAQPALRPLPAGSLKVEQIR